VGAVNKKDVMEALAVKEQDKYKGVVIAFNTPVLPESRREADEENVKIFEELIIYKIVENYEEWKKNEKEREKKELLESATYPVKVKLIPGFVFRKSKPAVVGVEVIEGVLKSPCPLMNENGERRGKIKEIQDKNETIPTAEAGQEVAVSIHGVTIGRQVKEGDVLYSHIPLEKIYELEKEVEEKELINKIKKIKKRGKIE
jgi:translation initiation factor 5B